jgi:hypothetical protein
MAMNLFTGALAQLRLEDLDAFLGLSGPREDRPREGTRIHYAIDVPDHLGDTVAAFANTDGGIIILGVSARDGIPVERAGVLWDPKSDLETRIANAICSNVRPRPRFEIGVAPFEASVPVLVAVLRIEEGDYPPYMFTRAGANKIPVRIGDRNVPADLHTLEAMFARRAQLEVEGQRPFPGGELVVSHHGDGTPQPSATQLTLRARPRRNLRVRLDAAMEQELLQLLWHATQLRPGPVVSRRKDYFQTAFVAEPPIDHEHAWRIGADGSVAFSTQILSLGGREILLQELVDDALRFCLGANAMLLALGCPGRLDLELSLQLGGAPVRSMAMGNEPQQVLAFRPLPEAERLEHEVWAQPMDLSDLNDPVDLVVEALNERLRDLTDAALDRAWFARAVRELWESIQTPSTPLPVSYGEALNVEARAEPVAG